VRQELYVVTGTTRGLGRHVALELLQLGHRVVGLARSNRDIRSPLFMHVPCDLEDPRSYLRGLADALRVHRESGADWARSGLVNCAALADGTPDEIIRVSLCAPAELARLYAELTEGWVPDRRICNVGSGYAETASTGHWAYAAAKAGLMHMTRCLQLRWADMRVEEFRPGRMDTAMGTPDGRDPREAALELVTHLRHPSFGRSDWNRPPEVVRDPATL
jgi:benzil reductase ((S)-benzoin forming)